MKITTIRASYGRTIPHPNESYSNIKAFVELTAAISSKEDESACIVKLQQAAATLLEEEVTRRLDSIKRQAEIERAAREKEYEKRRILHEAEQAVRDAEARLENIREGREADDDGIPF